MAKPKSDPESAYAKISALWRKTKKQHGDEISQYDWGYRDGVLAARALFEAPKKQTSVKIGGVAWAKD